MDDETTTEGTETPTVATGDVEENKPNKDEKGRSLSGGSLGKGRVAEGEAEAGAGDETGELVEGGEGGEAGKGGEGAEVAKGDEVPEGAEGAEGAEGVKGAEVAEGEEAGTEDADGEHVEGEYGEEYEEYYVEEEIIIEEQVEGEQVEGEEKAEGEELPGEGAESEPGHSEVKEEVLAEEVGEEEQGYPEEPPPDPAAPYDFSDSKEALKAPFELRPDQLAEVEQLWEIYQNYTPAYSDLDGFVTEKELVYMLKCLLLMTYTAEQLQELIAYCCRPPDAKGHVTYEQFLKMVTIRQRDFPIEEEIRSALQVYDPDRTGIIDREYLKEILGKHGNKMHAKMLDNLIKEVDMSNDGTIGVEDVVGTMCIDLNKDDLQMLRAAVNPPEHENVNEHQEDQEEELDDDD